MSTSKGKGRICILLPSFCSLVCVLAWFSSFLVDRGSISKNVSHCFFDDGTNDNQNVGWNS